METTVVPKFESFYFMYSGNMIVAREIRVLTLMPVPFVEPKDPK